MRKMQCFRILWLLVIVISTTSCSRSHDLNYYLLHPEALKVALNHCQQYFKDAVCRDILLTAQSHPQEFGTNILKLQQDLIAAQQQLEKLQHEQGLAAKDPVAYRQQSAQLSQQIKDYQHKNQVYLSIVRWLENPEA